VLPLIDAFRPQAIMLQAGADGLDEDPLAKLSLSNNAHCAVARDVRGRAPRLIVLGGGGYNPWSVGRCWAAIWGTLNDFTLPDRLPDAAERVLRDLRYDRAAGRNPPAHWFTTLRDPPREGPVREPVERLADQVLKETPPA
jgi:acetoin utilization protein AcuC